MSVLITGGTGFIGSHTVVEIQQQGYDAVVLDNLSNSKKEVVDRIERITGKKITFYRTDLLDREGLGSIFRFHKFSSVIHFAAAKVLGASISQPLSYYRNNVEGSINLIEMMEEFGVKNLVFSSTAAVYAEEEESPLTEESQCRAETPYGRTKLITEDIIKDVHNSEKGLNAVILRYFNPIGAHPSGLIGEEPPKNPDNLMPYVGKAAAGEIPYVTVYGNDYDTIDGTGVRDFIHIVDLARGHINALEKLQSDGGIHTYNLGCGRGCSVLEVIKAYEKVSGKKIEYRFAGRRAGDLACVYANPSKAERELNWKAEKKLEDMCRDHWNWMRESRSVD